MGFIGWLLKLVGWKSARDPAQSRSSRSTADAARRGSTDAGNLQEARARRILSKLTPNRRRKRKLTDRQFAASYVESKGAVPYRYARFGSQTNHYLDLSRDTDASKLARFRLPVFQTPEQLADWLGLPLNKVAWLVHRFSRGRPNSVKEAHYCFRWVQKKHNGWRLIESPKSTLKSAQSKILHDLLDHVPCHDSAHGFATGRSILTNAQPHVGQELLIKYDLQNFYTTVGFARVVAVFRSLGYSREAAIWLGLLTTSAAPGNFSFEPQGPYASRDYLRRHLPQGAPTSPSLANLSAFGLDIRLAGLARSFDMNYTRYADDLTFSGPNASEGILRTVIPLIQTIIRQERFKINPMKTRILRSHQRQTVTGVVVNEKPNVSRDEYDRLKAILTNCLRFGPSTQNRHEIENFYHHLQGRIAHVTMLNSRRGKYLGELFFKIDWAK